jgi:3-deoxy-D-manno-octulosonate 8-phosphate phosphatase (KDO 8-P phosphatase)
MSQFLQKLEKAEAFIFDVDGVLTDGTVLVTEDGKMLRNMSIKDGFILQLAVKLGLKIAIITGGKSEGVIKRLTALGIEDVFAGISDKIEVLETYLSNNNINPDYCVYMGDDIPDLTILNMVGLSCCPANAVTEVLDACQYVSPFDGGKGCVRDVIEKSLRLKGLWNPENQGSW